MIKVETIFFYIGFFLCFPFLYIPIGSSNIRFEDIAVLLLLFFAFIYNKKLFSKSILVFSTIFVLFIVYGLSLRPFFDFNYENYPLTRIVGITMYFFVFAFYMKQEEVKSLCKGAFAGSLLSAIVILSVLLMHLVNIGFTIRNMYVFKESLRGISSFNPNSYGALMVFGSFASYYLFSLTKKSMYRYAACFFLLIPFILIIRRDIVGIIFALISVFFISRNTRTKIILYPTLIIICLYIGFSVVNYLQGLDSYRFMAHRDTQYIAALSAIQENKMGYGLGSETFIMKDRINREAVTHNSFLSLSLDLGLFNALVVLGMIVFIFFNIKDKWFKFYLIAFFIQSLFGSGFYFFKYHYVFVAILLCTMTISCRGRNDEKNSTILTK
ncbi:hypothetical protein [Seleniivibrio woodruffii]|uniref:Uncharacterized protein n=1 Tax=Seleniivibrio woodruffii TaxID=1078050 RepID=A0A4R1KCM4_9BACT|nr:hypothetical protein [Seleniivibrio woodruffii]TCK62358.1 hypothetical protein C8D98_0883 [Seleniivibrio woodruffii]TVZ34525.1 hypothetical protein OF66_0110 [Seleniivibrio woodruffii]